MPNHWYIATADQTTTTADEVWVNWVTTSATSTNYTVWVDEGEELDLTTMSSPHRYQREIRYVVRQDQTAREETEAFRAARAAEYAQAQARHRERLAAVEADRVADPLGLRRSQPEREYDRAKGKALAILCEHLTREQIEGLLYRNWFEVVGSEGGRYQIDYGHAINVRGLNAQGEVMRTYCAHPQDAAEIPDCDSMLVQKLMLESDESGFKRVANAHRADATALVHA